MRVSTMIIIAFGGYLAGGMLKRFLGVDAVIVLALLLLVAAVGLTLVSREGGQ